MIQEFFSCNGLNYNVMVVFIYILGRNKGLNIHPYSNFLYSCVKIFTQFHHFCPFDDHRETSVIAGNVCGKLVPYSH